MIQKQREIQAGKKKEKKREDDEEENEDDDKQTRNLFRNTK